LLRKTTRLLQCFEFEALHLLCDIFNAYYYLFNIRCDIEISLQNKETDDSCQGNL